MQQLTVSTIMAPTNYDLSPQPMKNNLSTISNEIKNQNYWTSCVNTTCSSSLFNNRTFLNQWQPNLPKIQISTYLAAQTKGNNYVKS